MVILTHGEENDMLMANDGGYHLYKFLENFTPVCLKSMAGKPKLFIIQACRGKKADRGVQMRAKLVQADSGKDQVDSQREIFTYPEFADFLVVMSSHHGRLCLKESKIDKATSAFCRQRLLEAFSWELGVAYAHYQRY